MAGNGNEKISGNGTKPITEAICKEKVKRIDGDISEVDKKADRNQASIDSMRSVLISTLASANLSLLGIIVLIVRTFT